MMKRIFVALLLCACAAPAGAARQDIPDIVGTYPLAGTQSFYGCFTDGQIYTSPLAASLVVEEQAAAHFSGYIGFPQEQFQLFVLTGTVGADGALAGTWQYFDPQTDELFFEKSFTGRAVGGKAEIELLGRYGVEGQVECSYEVALGPESTSLSWLPPDVESGAENPPPRALQVGPTVPAPEEAAERQGDIEKPTAYNVYRSSTPGVQPTSANLYASVPSSQTSVPGPVGVAGSFFVVTAVYPDGESAPSNEVSGGVEAATLGRVKVSGAKIKASGSGFSSTVQVLVDGIPFVSRAKVKNNKVTQKGALLTGQTLGQYITSGKTVAITFRNANGGVATYIHTEP
jgi:hypothetical protein